MQRYPINPIRTDFGSILPCPGGVCIFQFNELHEDAPDEARDHLNRYLATLADLGFTAYVGSIADFALHHEATR